MIVTLMGGLCNQLFQYAFGVSVAKARGEDLLFARNRVDRDVKRSYSLGAFQAPIRFAPNDGGILYYDGGVFTPDVYKVPRNTTFVGYWQTEKYFDVPIVREYTQLRE